MDESFEQAMTVRRAVLGEEYVAGHGRGEPLHRPVPGIRDPVGLGRGLAG